MEAVVLKNLTKVFGNKVVLHNLSLAFEKGKMIGIVGPDGAGKSTLMRLLAGIMEPTEGTVKHKGAGFIGYMPQRFGLYEDLTVLQNLTLYARLKKVEQGVQFDELLAFTTLTPFIDFLSRDLSGGMKQKLGLACALLGEPDILVLDEPSVGVDPLSRRELWKMVQKLLKKKTTILWSTTYLNEAENCDDVVLLNEGKLLFHGSPQELTKKVEGRVLLIKTDKREETLAGLLKREEILDAQVDKGGIRVLSKTLLTEGEAISPRFEDAFIDALGGVPKVASTLTDLFTCREETDKPLVEALHLTKRFGAFTAVNAISFTVGRGEIFGIIGPNGAGKSTIFKMLCGLLKPTDGEAFVGGINLQAAPSIGRAKIGYMAQRFSLYGDLSVIQNLSFFAGVYGVKDKKKIINTMASLFGLNAYFGQSTHLLSLGFKQRLALACALMHMPEVLFLDEPTSGVDPITRREFWQHIRGLAHKGVAIVITTHHMDEAAYCDRIAFIYQSQCQKITTPAALEAQGLTVEEAFIQCTS